MINVQFYNPLRRRYRREPIAEARALADWDITL